MRLSAITAAHSRPFTFNCAKCGSRTHTERNQEARADLDGMAFVAYFCGQCAAQLVAAQASTAESKVNP